MCVRILVVMFFVFCVQPLRIAASPLQVKEPALDPSSFECLGVCWDIAGEEARVHVHFRKDNGGDWREAMPLFRLETDDVREAPASGYTRFAGSVFGLESDTRYELRLTASVNGSAAVERRLEARTRLFPAPPAPQRVLHVAPGDGGGDGTRSQPYLGLAAAERVAKAGDLVELLPGTYTGTIGLQKDGTAEAPIVWRGPTNSEAVLRVPADKQCLTAYGRKYRTFQNITFQDARHAAAIAGASHLLFERCRFTNVGGGVFGDALENRIVVSDCTFDGRLAWPKTGRCEEWRAIELSGSGHVICHNRIRGFKDGIDTRKPGPVTGVDIYNNDISQCWDDGIETDFSDRNVRVFRNRITDVHLAISFQPAYGGPVYAIRNALYGVVHEPFKLHITPPKSGATSGGVLLHNTVYKKGIPLIVWSDEGPADNFYARNNIFASSEGSKAIEITCPMRRCDFDYDLYAGPFELFANWNKERDPTLAAFRERTGQEQHGIVTDSVSDLFASGLPAPDPMAVRDPALCLLELAPGSPAIDQAVLLPNINDTFCGKGPDIGCMEHGNRPPEYGPRPVE